MRETDWEARYQTGDMPWEKGAAAPGLVDFLAANPKLPRGKVCVPGCGTGHDVRAWAGAGFEVYGCDIAPTAIRVSRERTVEADLPASFELRDFLEDEPLERFDWIFEHTLFCAIDPAQRGDYARAVLRWLKPEGRFLAIHFLIPDEEGPPYGSTHQEILARFTPHFELIKDWTPRSFANRQREERMYWWNRRVI